MRYVLIVLITFSFNSLAASLDDEFAKAHARLNELKKNRDQTLDNVKNFKLPNLKFEVVDHSPQPENYFSLITVSRQYLQWPREPDHKGKYEDYMIVFVPGLEKHMEQYLAFLMKQAEARWSVEKMEYTNDPKDPNIQHVHVRFNKL